jgi:hypothetical protein
MAKHRVLHVCLHESTVSTDSVKYQERLLARAAALLCPECFQILAEERAKCRADEAKLLGFVALKGSAPQKRWAEDIRAKKLQELEKRITILEGEALWRAPDLEGAAALRDCIAQLGRIAEAAWWIRHREYDFMDKTLRELALGRLKGR